jgi:flagellar basal-body rod protein FlgF
MEMPSLMAMSRQMSIQQEMDAIANNIANANTVGYKADRVTFNQYLPQQNGLSGYSSMIFPKLASPFRDTEEGIISTTSDPLDVAIKGSGYLVIDTPKGQRYTRDGHLTLNASGQMINAAGSPVLDDGGRPITIPPNAGSITIDTDGSVSAGGQTLGKIRVVTFDDEQSLKRAGAGLYDAHGMAPKTAQKFQIIQGSLESSNISPVMEMTRMMENARAYEEAQKVVSTEDDRMRKGIELLGKVA